MIPPAESSSGGAGSAVGADRSTRGNPAERRAQIPQAGSSSGRAVAIGDPRRLAGFRLAGADVAAATDRASITAAWDGLGEDVALAILTPAAHGVLRERLEEKPHRVWVVLP
jgi:hypothetical protein